MSFEKILPASLKHPSHESDGFDHKPEEKYEYNQEHAAGREKIHQQGVAGRIKIRKRIAYNKCGKGGNCQKKGDR